MKSLLPALLLLGFLKTSAQMPRPDVHYKINATHSPHYISINANSFKNGTALIQWENPPGTCEDGQAYRFEKVGDFYKLTARKKYGKCITILENRQGGKVGIDDFKNADSQLWQVEDLGSKLKITSKLNGMSLNISGANPNNGGEVIVWPYTASANDQFRITPAEEETPYWENLGPEVNTSQSEFSPCFSPDGKTMFFSRGNERGKYIYDAEVYMASLKDDGTWGNVKRMKEFDFGGQGKVVSFLPGGNEVVLFGDFSGGKDLFSITERTAGGWSKPRPMGIKNPGIKYNSWSGVIGSDGRTMVIDMNLTDYNDESDMYVSFKDDNGRWSEPKYMGDVINKPRQWDGTPYLSPDMKTLYFNATRPGRNGTDFYMARRLDDTWTNWSEPVIIEKGIYIYSIVQNYSVPGDGEWGYFVSGMKTFGEGDILRMKTTPNVRPEAFMFVNGKTLSSKDKKPLKTTIFFEDLETGKRVGEVVSNPAGGDYQIALPKGKNYGVYASADGYYAITENIDLKALTGFKNVEKNLLLSPIERGEIIRLNNIFFDFGKSTLRPESHPELDRVVKMLNANNSINIEIRGHTDNVGDDKSNLTLSDSRAKAVRDYLLLKGIAEGRVRAKGFGESKPVSENTTEEGRQNNRRVEFEILGK